MRSSWQDNQAGRRTGAIAILVARHVLPFRRFLITGCLNAAVSFLLYQIVLLIYLDLIVSIIQKTLLILCELLTFKMLLTSLRKEFRNTNVQLIAHCLLMNLSKCK